VNRFAWTNANTIVEAASAASTTVARAMMVPGEVMDHGDTVIVKANGIDVLDLLKERLLKPSKIVSLTNVPGLNQITEGQDGSLRIGPMVTLTALGENAIVQQRYPALATAVRNSASPQIRNAATLGGNLLQRPRCWYFRSEAFHCLRKGGGHCFAITGENQYHAIFDNMPCAIVHPSTAATVLVALDATIELTNARGATRKLLLEQFFVSPAQDLHRENDLQPQELLTAICLPKLAPSVRVLHLKQGEKDSFDWPLADVAIALDLDTDGVCKKASVILGAAAPVPHRARAAEAALTGRRIDEKVAAEAGHAALDGATPLSQNAYKLPLFEALVRRATLQTAGTRAESGRG
jgi:xanthine dehydrogenase YagS FAD-binding subunit